MWTKIDRKQLETFLFQNRIFYSSIAEKLDDCGDEWIVYLASNELNYTHLKAITGHKHFYRIKASHNYLVLRFTKEAES